MVISANGPEASSNLQSAETENMNQIEQQVLSAQHGQRHCSSVHRNLRSKKLAPPLPELVSL